MVSATDEMSYKYAMNGHYRNDINAISVADTVSSTRDYKVIGVVDSEAKYSAQAFEQDASILPKRNNALSEIYASVMLLTVKARPGRRSHSDRASSLSETRYTRCGTPKPSKSL